VVKNKLACTLQMLCGILREERILVMLYGTDSKKIRVHSAKFPGNAVMKHRPMKYYQETSTTGFAFGLDIFQC